ncbi:Protein CBG27213 [Caenorhabditis briggsae]|uniref:Uncharacterized protein n=2 Tax=Caenorhabditis briggsae TaxID=6238 RepID=A0AAE9JM83_CAEBR|nr:Protein CBG27213 [Caenorhabditis briggsae]UMM36879.1 hypothetical protein L5515_008845 [Caenorhabditis briggsae]CAR99636.1 Protein CBG27213 [Caenorhabditis briggsae]
MRQDDDAESMTPEDENEGNLKMAVGATNTRKIMVYSRKVFSVVSCIFLAYALGNMTLFITPGVREFVQQYHFLVYLCTPLPLISKILISGIERLSHPPKLPLLYLVFILHLLAIFLSFTSLSLFFDTEIAYFSCFIIFMNLILLVFYTLQNSSVLSAPRMFLLLIVITSVNSVLLPTFLSIFVFPYIPVIVISLLVTFYINFNICHFTNSLSSRDWPIAAVWIFSRLPL